MTILRLMCVFLILLMIAVFDEIDGFVAKEKLEEVEIDEETKLDATEDYMIVVKKRKPKQTNQAALKLTEDQAKRILKDILSRWNYSF